MGSTNGIHKPRRKKRGNSTNGVAKRRKAAAKKRPRTPKRKRG